MADGPLRSVLSQMRQLVASQGTVRSWSDAELIDAFIHRRDELAFEMLVWRHGRMVFNLCQRILHDEHQAEDAFQAAFLVLVRKAESIGKRQSVGSWLYKVTHRLAWQLRTRLAKQHEQRAESADLDSLPGREPAQDLIWRELRPLLDEEIGRLPEKLRFPIVLCYLQGHTTEEAAQLLHCPKGTLLARLASGRDLLRSRLMRRGLALPAGWLATDLSVNTLSAAVPMALGGSTVKAAMEFAAGNGPFRLVPSSVALLTQGVLRAMFLDKLKIMAIILCTIAVLGLGAGFVAQWALAAGEPRGNALEVLDRAIAVSQPAARAKVKNSTVRVLLFAGSPSREYQFLRTLLARQAEAKVIELAVYLQQGSQPADSSQPALDQVLPDTRQLDHFPHLRGPVDVKDRFYNLDEYDVIIAVDPDWSALNANVPSPRDDPKRKITNVDVAKAVTNWVAKEGGGIIFVAGRTNTYQLSSSRDDPSLADLPKMVPVILKDIRNHELGIDFSRPYPLTFTPSALLSDWCRLDPDPQIPGSTAGWEHFFWGKAGLPEVPDTEPKFGFFTYYPVEDKRAGAVVLATFSGPKETLIKNQTEEQPYLAAMPYGRGRTVYIGSGESYRLRQASQSYHRTFWLNMLRLATGRAVNREKS